MYQTNPIKEEYALIQDDKIETNYLKNPLIKVFRSSPLGKMLVMNG